MKIAQLPGWSWALMVLAGSAVRFWYGTHHQLWNCAPDQLAWGYVLDDLAARGDLSYARLIHYPHEGGSLFISLLAIILRPLGMVMPPLSWAAFLLDTLSRYLQVRLALRLFGQATAVGFGIWSILAVPLLLPWATVDFGLHALMSFAPLLLVRYALAPSATPIRVGIACGVGISLAYDLLVFVPAYLVWCVSREHGIGARSRQAVLFLAGCALALIPHLLLRLAFDNAFMLEQLSPLTVRGLPLAAALNASAAAHLLFTATATLPASYLLAAIKLVPAETVYRIVLVFLLVGVSAALFPRRDRSPAVVLLALVVLSFIVLFALGPFYMERADVSHYVLFRHFGFIAPTLVVLMLYGFTRLRRAGIVLISAWCALCMTASVRYMAGTVRCDTPGERAAGWVLGRKFGHDPDALMHIAGSAQVHARNELLIGYGWGITATVLEHCSAGDTASVARVRRILGDFPALERPLLLEGMRVAFGPGITPHLDPLLLQRLTE